MIVNGLGQSDQNKLDFNILRDWLEYIVPKLGRDWLNS